MFPYVFIALLAINIILLIFVLVKGSKRTEITAIEPLFDKPNNHEKMILRELIELRKGIERLSTVYQQDIQQLREEHQQLLNKAKQDVYTVKTENVKKPEKVENSFIKERYREIFELRDQGLTEEQIAKELGKGCGEISLILQLAGQKQK